MPRDLFDAGRYLKARDLLCAVLEKEPYHVRALGLRGIVWNALGAYDQVVQDFDRALELRGLDPRLLMHRGFSWAGLGTFAFGCSPYRRAIEDYSRALEIDPKDELLWQLRGTAWFQIARKAWFGAKTALQQAIDDYTESLRWNPDDADTWQHRALAHWRRRDFEAVVGDCSEALRLNPDQLDALGLRSYAYHRLKRFEEAEKDEQTLHDRVSKQSDGRKCSRSVIAEKRAVNKFARPVNIATPSVIAG